MYDSTITLGSLIAIITFLVTWSVTAITLSTWLNKRFNELTKEQTFLNFITTYERRHSALSKRIYNIEIWAAAKNGPHPKYEIDPET